MSATVIQAQIRRRGTLRDRLPRFIDIATQAYYPAIADKDNVFTFTPDAAPAPGDCLLDRATGNHYIASSVAVVLDRRGRDVYLDTTMLPAQLFTVQRFIDGAVNAFGRPAGPELQTVYENVPVHFGPSSFLASETAPDRDQDAVRYRLTIPVAYDIQQHDRLVGSDNLIVRAVGIADAGFRTLLVERDRR